MATNLILETTNIPLSGLVEKFDTLLNKLHARWKTYRTFQRTVEELNSYSDRQLADMGFARHEIPDLVKRSLSNQRG